MKQSYWIWVVIIAAIVFSGYIRLIQTANFNFPFTYDQARDMLDIRILGELKGWVFYGPTTSINGLFLGPGYYYFNLPAFWLGQGSPQALINWNIFWYLLGGLAIFVFFYKRDKYLGLLIALIYLFSPQLFNTTRYFWNAHSMIYMMVFYFLSLYWFWEKPEARRALILGLVSGISMHFEAAMGVAAISYAGLIVFLKEKRFLGWFFLGLIPTFVFQIAIELKHGFLMSRILIKTLTGSEVLGEKLGWLETFKSHGDTFLKYFEGQFILGLGWGKALLSLAMLVGIFSKKYRKTTLWLGGFLLWAFGFYLITYHHELKIWYGESLRVWYCFMAGIGIMAGVSIFRKKVKAIFIALIIIFIFRNIWLTYVDQKQYFGENSINKRDPKLMSHIMEAVNWAYIHTEGKGFTAYNYVPETFDYPYQYVYWWRGMAKYGYTPEEVAYNRYPIEYVTKREKFLDKNKKANGLAVLIYEKNSQYEKWRDSFSDYCLAIQKEFDWGVKAEVRTKCK